MFRSWTLWALGYLDAALADAYQAVDHARDIGQAASLMYALGTTSLTHVLCGNYALANAQLDELGHLANEKASLFWKAFPIATRGCLYTQIGNAVEAVQVIKSGMSALHSTGASMWEPLLMSYLAKSHAELGQFDDAWRCIGEATTSLETAKEKFFEAEVYRISGEIERATREPDSVQVQASFKHSLAVARQQQAKSWELRAAMSLARLWRDQGKASEARELLAPVYGWFTEGFDTRDLKEAKALLEALAA